MGAGDDTRRVAGLAARQHGSVTYAQMRAIGLSRGEIAERSSRGWLMRRHTGVYAVGHGILVHRQRLPAAHATVHCGIPVTTPIRTLLDLAAVLNVIALAKAFEQAQVRLKVPLAPLAAEVLSRPRQRGNAKLRRILLGAVDPADVRSVLELRFLRMCASHDIPRPQVNVPIGAWTPDFLWPDLNLVVETDGFEFHRTAAARRRDAIKDDFLRGVGLDVIRLTWADVTERAAATVVRLRGATSVV